jgi:hypothetical protein
MNLLVSALPTIRTIPESPANDLIGNVLALWYRRFTPPHRNVKLSPSGWPMRRRAVHLEDYLFLSPLHFPWSRATGFSAVQLSA